MWQAIRQEIKIPKWDYSKEEEGLNTDGGSSRLNGRNYSKMSREYIYFHLQ